MSWSVPIQAGWKLRVLSGSSLGKEYPLGIGSYILGSDPSAAIRIPDPNIAPRHLTLNVRADHVDLQCGTSGSIVLVNDRSVTASQIRTGDRVQIGNFQFELVNPAVSPATKLTLFDFWASKLAICPVYQRIAIVMGPLTLLLALLLVGSRNPNLFPVTLFAMSAFVPAVMIAFLIERYDRTKLSFHTLAITFLLGGSLGLVVTMVIGGVAGTLTGGLLLLPIFAGVWEEPAKLMATSWRWRHPRYDRPMDGLILGTVAGLGFAVFETAGFGFQALLDGGIERLLVVLVMRGLLAPFGHGLWSGLLAAAFWTCGRDVHRAAASKPFWKAVAMVIGLHALWNAGGAYSAISWIFTLLSAGISFDLYRRILARDGYWQ